MLCALCSTTLLAEHRSVAAEDTSQTANQDTSQETANSVVQLTTQLPIGSTLTLAFDDQHTKVEGAIFQRKVIERGQTRLLYQTTAQNIILTGHFSSLNCDYNQLTSINVVQAAPQFTRLSCANNLLTQLDLQQIPHLTLLDCSSNNILVLDIRCTPLLNHLNCCNNPDIEIVYLQKP